MSLWTNWPAVTPTVAQRQHGWDGSEAWWWWWLGLVVAGWSATTR